MWRTRLGGTGRALTRASATAVLARAAAVTVVLAAAVGCGSAQPSAQTPPPLAAPTSARTSAPAPAQPGSPPPSSTAPPRTTRTSADTAVHCGPFGHALDPVSGGAGVEGAGCGPGQTPPFSVPTSGWEFAFAYTCSGTFGADGMRESLVVTPVKVAGGSVAASSLAGPWGSGASLAGEGTPAPAGRYVLKVTLAHPDANQCQWRLRVPGSTP